MLPIGRERVQHRKRLKTEEKAKDVAAEIIQFLAALALLHQDHFKKRMLSSVLILLLWSANCRAYRKDSHRGKGNMSSLSFTGEGAIEKSE